MVSSTSSSTITKPMPTSTNNITMPTEYVSTFQRPTFAPVTTTIHMQQTQASVPTLVTSNMQKMQLLPQVTSPFSSHNALDLMPSMPNSLPLPVWWQVKPQSATVLMSSVPKSTYYRHLKKAADSSAGQPAKTKVYSCRKCGQSMNAAGHSQYSGQRYCPNEPGAIPLAQWLEVKRIEKLSKTL